jgi:hypothetical protein
MATQKLTKRVIDGMTAADSNCIVWDSDLAGIGIRMRPGGSKTFIAQYRAGGERTGQTRRYTVGRYV